MGRRLIPGVDSIKEDWVKDRVKETLKEFRVQYFMPSASAFGKAGAHDFICCYKTRYISVETKAGKRPPVPLQKKFAREAQKQGGICLLINEMNYQVVRSLLLCIKANKLPNRYTGHDFEKPIKAYNAKP